MPSVGGAFVSGFQESLMQREALKRQHLEDMLRVKHEERMAQAELDRVIDRRKHEADYEADRKEAHLDRQTAQAENAHKAEVTEFEKWKSENTGPGDFVPAERMKQAIRLGYGSDFKSGTQASIPEVAFSGISPTTSPGAIAPTSIGAPLSAQPTGRPAETMQGPGMALGNRAQREAIRIGGMKPGPEQNREIGIMELGEKKTPSVGLFAPPKSETVGNANYDLPGVGPIVGQHTKEGRVLYKGKDVTDEVKPYFREPQHSALEKGWSVQKVSHPDGTEVLERVNAATGEHHPFEGMMPLLPGQQRGQMMSASQVVSHFDNIKKEIEDADKRGLLGPVKGRFSEFLAGTLGSTGNPEYDNQLNKLRMDLLLVKSGVTKVHFGARGGQTYIDKMNRVLDSGKMNKEELIGALDGAAGWLHTYSRDPRTSDVLQEEVDRKTPPSPKRGTFNPKTGKVE